MKSKVLQNKYKIVRILGQNIFSETFLAKDRNWRSSQRYIIKKFRPILGNPQAKAIRELFYREASVLKLLSGENVQIPQLYEYFMDGEDFYLVREWISGITLEQKVQHQGKLPENEVIEILSSILSVLKYIHNYGIVYRQLKPSSIVLCKDSWRNIFDRHKSKNSLPIPIYFGGVKDLEKKIAQLPNRSLVLANQQEYTPPEEEQGGSVYASDLYSLGLTAIYLLTGKTPAEFKIDPDTNCLLWQQEVPQINNNLARVINRAICTSTGDRFTSAEKMLRSLNPQLIDISQSSVSLPEKKPILTPEVKITGALSALGLGVLGMTFALLNLDLFQPFNSHDDQEVIADQNKTSSSSLVETSKTIPDSSLNIPAFRVDSPQEQIVNLLGKPTKQSSGYWGNSHAFIYQDFIPQQVNLGYLIDNQTKTIRQTEMSFTDLVKLTDIHKAVRHILLEDYSREIEQKIDRVFAKKSQEEKFVVDNLNLKGIIQRDEQNRIYIAIWDRDFHD